jgi:hypothetical protein
MGDHLIRRLTRVCCIVIVGCFDNWGLGAVCLYALALHGKVTLIYGSLLSLLPCLLLMVECCLGENDT